MYLSPNRRPLLIALGIATSVFLVALLIIWGLNIRNARLHPPPPAPQSVTLAGVLTREGPQYVLKDFVLLQTPAGIEKFLGREVEVVGRATTTAVQGQARAPLELVTIAEVVKPAKKAEWPAAVARSNAFPLFLQYPPEWKILAQKQNDRGSAILFADPDARVYLGDANAFADTPPFPLDQYTVIDQKKIVIAGFSYSLRTYGTHAEGLPSPVVAVETTPDCRRAQCPALFVELRSNALQTAMPLFEQMLSTIAFPPEIAVWTKMSASLENGHVFSVRYPALWEVSRDRDETFDTIIFTDPRSAERVAVIAAKANTLPRAALPLGRIEEIANGAKGTLYHDRDAKTGEQNIDKAFFISPDGVSEVLIQGDGPVYDAVMMSFEWEK